MYIYFNNQISFYGNKFKSDIILMKLFIDISNL